VGKYLTEGGLFDESLTVLGTSSTITLMLATLFALLGKMSMGTGSVFAIGIVSVSIMGLEFDFSEIIFETGITSLVSGAGSGWGVFMTGIRFFSGTLLNL